MGRVSDRLSLGCWRRVALVAVVLVLTARPAGAQLIPQMPINPNSKPRIWTLDHDADSNSISTTQAVKGAYYLWFGSAIVAVVLVLFTAGAAFYIRHLPGRDIRRTARNDPTLRQSLAADAATEESLRKALGLPEHIVPPR
jgi:hypothetical protein